MNRLLLILLLLLISNISLLPQSYIRNIYIEKHDVYDSIQVEEEFAGDLFNTFHIVTKDHIIEDEILFDTESPINIELIEETERNLRYMGIFSSVKIELDSVSYDEYNAYIVTQDRWSTYPSFLIGFGGGEREIGGGLKEYNFLGNGIRLGLEAIDRSVNEIGWQGEVKIYKTRLFRSEFTLNGLLRANRFRTDQNLSFIKPFRTLATKFSYGISGINIFGSDFFYGYRDSINLLPIHEKIGKAWFSRSWRRDDRIFATGSIEIDDTYRGDSIYSRAYDNSGKILLAFSSVSQKYYKTNRLNTYKVEDLPVGGWGTAILGKIFPMNSLGEDLYYVGAQGEQSYYDNDLYLYGRLSAGSSFKGGEAKYTSQGFYGLAFYRFIPELLIAAQVQQRTAWQWDKLRQLVLDDRRGLRGYDANKLSGDNRLISNLEIRSFPDVKFWILRFSGAIFWDVGAVWNQGLGIDKAQFHNSAGFGIRLHDTKSQGDKSIIRIDFAYNFDKGKFGGLIFTTEQLFSVFGQHEYKLPEIEGLEFDFE